MRVWCVGLMLLLGCSQGSSLNRLRPGHAELSSTHLTLPTTETGLPVMGEVVVRNTGEAPLQAELRLEPADTPFTLSSTHISVEYDGTHIRVDLLAPEPGHPTATLHVDTDGEEPQQLTVAIEAEVKPPPNCDDGNPCTLDARDGDGCAHVPLDAPCSDGNACTRDDRCVDGTCTGGPPLRCDDGVQCTVDVCDRAAGCVFTPRAEACDDGVPCTLDVCTPGVGCSNATAPDGTLCGVASCTELPVCVGGQCRAINADGFPCEDGDPCSLGDRCMSGTCMRGVGDPMGVGDPILVSTEGMLQDGVKVVPVAAVGMVTRQDGGVRVAWLSDALHVEETCSDAGCPALVDRDAGCPATPPRAGSAITLSDVEEDGTVTHGARLDAPSGAHNVLSAHGATTENHALWVGSLWRMEDTCGQARLVPAVHRVDDNGLRGPFLLPVSSDAPEAGRPATAVAVEGDTMAMVVHDTPGRLHVWVLGISQFPPEILRDDVITLPPDADRPSNVSISLHNRNVMTAWLGRSATPEPLMCGAVEALSARAFTYKLPASMSAPGVLDEVTVPMTQMVDVETRADVSGQVLWRASESFITSDAGCTVEDEVTEQRPGGGRVVLQASSDGTAAVTGLGSGSAFNRAVVMVVRRNGEIVVAAPPTEVSPQIQTSFMPPQAVPLRVDVDSPLLLEGEALTAWLGAMLVVEVGPGLRGLAVAPAGCGRVPAGVILNLPSLDGGLPDFDAAFLFDAGTADAAASDDAGEALDAGLDDAGEALDAGLDDAGDADAGIDDAGDADAGIDDAGEPDAA